MRELLPSEVIFQVAPDPLHGVPFRRVGRQAHQAHVGWDGAPLGGMRAAVVEEADVRAVSEGLGGPVAAPLGAYVHERTEGNALFMVNILDHLVQQRFVVRREGQWTLRAGADAKLTSLPEGLQQFLVRRIEDLPPDARRVLEAASVVGETFAVAAVAAGAQCPVTEVDAVCEGLARQQHFIADTGPMVWPDATSGGSYRFQHALYQQVL